MVEPIRSEREDSLKHYMVGISGRGISQYVKTRAHSFLRYMAESSVQNFLGWIPGFVGMGLRSAIYPALLSSGSGFPVLEHGCELFHMNRIKFGQSVYVDTGCRLHASRAAIELGDYTRIMRGAYLCSYVSNAHDHEGIVTGRHCWLGINAVLASGQGGIFLGNNVLVGPNAVIVTGEHDFRNTFVSSVEQDYTGKPIHIDDNAWIGAGAIILGGVRIGEHAVIGAGAVVTKSVEPYTVVAGVPARHIGDIS